MAYAILRVQKLKSSIAVHRSMKHAFREQDTPNADAERTPENTHIGATDVREGMQAFRARLPEKFRKDAVQAIEYLVTASPEAMKEKSRAQQDAYFSSALDWLKEKHGAENVVYAGIHRDETTPHMYAYVVPRVGEKLNCRAFLGGAKALSDMQTDFALKVGLKHDLERGVKGSKSHHTTISQYYARTTTKTPEKPAIRLPEASLADRLKPVEFAKKVARSVIGQLEPREKVLASKALEADIYRDEAKLFRDIAARKDRELAAAQSNADRRARSAFEEKEAWLLDKAKELAQEAATERTKRLKAELDRDSALQQVKQEQKKLPEYQHQLAALSDSDAVTHKRLLRQFFDEKKPKEVEKKPTPKKDRGMDFER